MEASTEDILANCLFFLYNVPVINITHNFEHELLFKMQGRFSAEIYTLKKKFNYSHIVFDLPTDPNMVAHSCRHATHHTVPDLCDTVSLHTILGFKHVTT